MKSIGEKAFYESGIRSIVFEDGSELAAIPASAFSSCSMLTAIALPAGIEEIGANAFYMSGLKSITLNEGLKKIGDAAFFDFAGDGVHGFKVAVGDAGKAGFNHVHAQPFHLPRHFQLFA